MAKRKWVFTSKRKESLVKARKIHAEAVKIGMRALRRK